MGKNDANNIFNLAVGAVVGVLIYTAYTNHLRSYAVDQGIDCDGPRPWNKRERARFDAMTDTQKRKYLVTRQQEFKELCHEAAQELNGRELRQESLSPMERNLSPGGSQYEDAPGDPLYPHRKPGSKGQGLEYPIYDDEAHAFFEPSLPSKYGGNQAAYALAYAAAKKKKKKAKGGGGKAAKGGGKDAGGGADTADAPASDAPTDTPAATDTPACDCSCMPMDSDPSKFKIETADGVDCYNHVYPPSKAECETALKEVCAKRASGGADLASAPDKTAKGGGGATDKAAKGGGKKAKSAAYAQAYAAYVRAYAAAKKKAAGGGKAADAPAPDAAPAKGAAAPAAAASGSGNCGKTVYTSTGKTASPKDTGQKTRHYQSGKPDDKTEEWNIANSPFKNYEYTTYVNVGKPDHDDQVSFKFYGPTHQDGKGAWHLVDVGFMKGDFSLGHEKPHPKTTMGEVKGQSIGSIVGKTVGLKGVIYQGPKGNHIEGWADVGGTWKKMVEGDNVGGKFAVDPNQNIQLRIDAAPQVKVQCAQATEITPPSGGASAAPASKAAPATPAKAAKSGAAYSYRVTVA